MVYDTYMSSELIFKIARILISFAGKQIVVKMDTYLIHGSDKVKYPPAGHKFSWIAFDLDNPGDKVLFDSHPPKGPHYHIDGDKEGKPFSWTSLEAAQDLFIQMAEKRFSVFLEIEE
jgi:hypothetical protein